MASQWILLLAMFFLANLPWLSPKLFGFWQTKQPIKSTLLSFVELLLLYFVVLFLARLAELNLMGQIAPQGWEFYSVTFALFVVFSSPGFIVKHFWRSK